MNVQEIYDTIPWDHPTYETYVMFGEKDVKIYVYGRGKDYPVMNQKAYSRACLENLQNIAAVIQADHDALLVECETMLAKVQLGESGVTIQ